MQYAERVGFDNEQADELWYYLTQMDEAWLEHQEKKRNTKRV
jgi:hypothetical protein